MSQLVFVTHSMEEAVGCISAKGCGGVVVSAPHFQPVSDSCMIAGRKLHARFSSCLATAAETQPYSIDDRCDKFQVS